MGCSAAENEARGKQVRIHIYSGGRQQRGGTEEGPNKTSLRAAHALISTRSRHWRTKFFNGKVKATGARVFDRTVQ
jgi:hypothetical protein